MENHYIMKEAILKEDSPSRVTIFEESYLDLVEHIASKGTPKINRTGIDTKSCFSNNTLEHDMRGPALSRNYWEHFGYNPHDESGSQFSTHVLPLLVYRPLQFRIAWYETLMFLMGITDTNFLEKRDIKIWKGNTTREFLDSRGLNHLSEGDMGKGYGFQWRAFGDITDQIEELLQNMINDPFSRRHIVTAWNPNQLSDMALPPCHLLWQLNVDVDSNFDDRYYVDIQYYMRSSDVVFGLPFNMVSYSLINILICSYLDQITHKEWVPRMCYYVAGDAHVYENQLDYVEEMLDRSYENTRLRRNVNSLEPTLLMPSEYMAEATDDFDSFLKHHLHRGFDLIYTPQEKMKTPRPSMAV